MRYEITTTLAPAVALAVAELFFSGDIGLLVGERELQELRLEGGGGHVVVRVMGGHPTTLEIETHGWDTRVMEFMRKLPR